MQLVMGLIALFTLAACRAPGPTMVPGGGQGVPSAMPESSAMLGTATAAPSPTVTSPSTPEGNNEGVAGHAVADVLSVDVSGDPGAYRFAVEVRSPDEGCDQYADWWEVLTEDGGLLYRRILAHSHVNEQPFVRSGGPVEIEPETIVIVRAHMHPAGYGALAMRGSAANGFAEVSLASDFAADVESEGPQPTGCAF